MNTRTRGVAFGDTQRVGGLVDEEVTAARPTTCQESLFAAGFDELQTMQRGVVAHRNDERAIVEAYPVRLGTFPEQIRMVLGRISSSMPDGAGFLTRLELFAIRLQFRARAAGHPLEPNAPPLPPEGRFVQYPPATFVVIRCANFRKHQLG